MSRRMDSTRSLYMTKKLIEIITGLRDWWEARRIVRHCAVETESPHDQNMKVMRHIQREAQCDPEKWHWGQWVGLVNGNVVVTSFDWREVVTTLEKMVHDFRQAMLFCVGDDDEQIDRWLREMVGYYQKRTRQMDLEPGDPGPVPVTKISGVPWWPKECKRPCCLKGHPLSFMAQILLSDVPELKAHKDTLLSFHYCDQCMLEGAASWGWTDESNRGYDLTVFKSVIDTPIDDIGIVAEPVLRAFTVQFSDVLERPTSDDMLVPQGVSSFENQRFRQYYEESICLERTKIGGWPSWAQYAEWPYCSVNLNSPFLAFGRTVAP